jgi:uncharacterized protein (DUF1015 family)
MSALYPFRALRPAPDVAARVASVPYDVVSTDEARSLVAGNPLSFLRVTRSEVDLAPETMPYDSKVYAQAVRNFEDLKRSAPLLMEDEPSLYVYRLRMGAHEQTGLAGCFSLGEYDRGLIRKHERTRKDKEDDRTRHIAELRAQTGIVLLTYRATAEVDAIAERVLDLCPLYDFVASDGISHTVWRAGGADTEALVEAFAAVPAMYIADGHHRAASAARAMAALPQSVEAARFIAVAFPDTDVQILPYNRVVKDLGGLAPDALVAALRARMPVTDGGSTPKKQGEIGMFLAGRWYTLSLPARGAPSSGDTLAADRADSLDVAALHRDVLEPLLKIGDIRADKRIDFVSGARGTVELERLVTSGRAAVAFSMFPVTIDDLIAIADEGGIMPPKSTWFEPKLRDGLLVHLI